MNSNPERGRSEALVEWRRSKGSAFEPGPVEPAEQKKLIRDRFPDFCDKQKKQWRAHDLPFGFLAPTFCSYPGHSTSQFTTNVPDAQVPKTKQGRKFVRDANVAESDRVRGGSGGGSDPSSVDPTSSLGIRVRESELKSEGLRITKAASRKNDLGEVLSTTREDGD